MADPLDGDSTHGGSNPSETATGVVVVAAVVDGLAVVVTASVVGVGAVVTAGALDSVGIVAGAAARSLPQPAIVSAPTTNSDRQRRMIIDLIIAPHRSGCTGHWSRATRSTTTSYAAGMRAPAIVHLIGFPAAGKLTIARALAELTSGSDRHFVVLDNHHAANVIFAALDLDGLKPVPPAVWDRVREVSQVLLRTVEELSPPAWSFVFTNVLIDDKSTERGYVDRLAGLARRTDRTFLPVLLRCDPAALTARVANPDRRDRLKWTDPAAVADFVQTHRLIDLSDLDPLTIDTSSTDPADAARLILGRLDRLDQDTPSTISTPPSRDSL